MAGGNEDGTIPEVLRTREGSHMTSKKSRKQPLLSSNGEDLVMWMWQPVGIELDARSMQIRHAKDLWQLGCTYCWNKQIKGQYFSSGWKSAVKIGLETPECTLSDQGASRRHPGVDY
jgi:hypothetical protein